MWEKPWKYKESLVICAGFFTIGILLQLTIGKININLLAFPVNVGMLGIFAGILIYLNFTKSYFAKWLSSHYAAIPSMLALAALIIVMGLTRQYPSETFVPGISGKLGIAQMLSSWSFALLFMWFLTILGMVIFRRAKHFKIKKDIPFMLNHLGLFIALTAGILGSADMQRLEITTSLKKAEWRATDKLGNMVELPLAIELNNFTIEEYPPKLMLVDNSTGKVLPDGAPENILLEDNVKSGTLLNWEITVIRHIEDAARVANSDTVNYVAFNSPGSTYAVYVKAHNKITGKTNEGWVSCGSFLFPYKAIWLDDGCSLIMPDREPKRYASDITVFRKDKDEVSGVVEVNKPLAVDEWKIYQVSYDEDKGKWSAISIFELVKDPWLPIVYTGIWMMIAGAIGMFMFAPKRKEDKE